MPPILPALAGQRRDANIGALRFPRCSVPAFPDSMTRPQPNTRSGSYFSFTRRTRSRLGPQ
jgi:hypothetical protein